MIKFFKNTRQQLIGENKAIKYFLYALGEIALLVIGILIALQIDNWNEQRKNNEKEKTYLENILSDLKNDKVKLIEIIERRADKAKSAEIMVNYHSGYKIDKLSDYYFHWTNVLYWEAHHPRKTSFEELVNSGNLSIIGNAQIKSLLLDISVSYEELFEVRRHMYDDYKLYLYNPYAITIDYGEGIEIWLNPNSKIQLSEENVQTALKSLIIKNGFTLAAFNNKGIKEQLIGILDKVELTINTIETELNNGIDKDDIN